MATHFPSLSILEENQQEDLTKCGDMITAVMEAH